VNLRIGTSNFHIGGQGWAAALANAHRDKQRPVCLCKTSGIEMYIAKINGNFYVKRMPGSGATHHPSCDAYEPPAEISGFSEVAGRAIQEDTASGESALKLSFALSKSGKRGPIAAAGETEKTSVKSDGSKLTPRGLLHYLWQEAGFNKWVPKMSGKRNWHVIRSHLLDAASSKFAKGVDLGSAVFIPETFSADDKAAIESRRRQVLYKVFGGSKERARPLMILIGEVKNITSINGHDRLIIKHLPDFPFMLDDDLSKRIAKHFATEFGLLEVAVTSHLIAIATFEMTETGNAWVQEIAFMNVNKDWLPFESSDELALIETLCEQERRFTKGLRFNARKDQPMASVVLSDTGDTSTALYVIPQNAPPAMVEAVEKIIAASQLTSWLWNGTVEAMPALPGQHKG
jgi:hypothetical protein